MKQPTTGDLLQEKQDKRDQFTWEVDFDDFEMPFKKNISTRCKLMADEDDWLLFIYMPLVLLIIL